MNTTFKTKQEAIAAGFRPANLHQDKDISGVNSRGYRYQESDGGKTVHVLCTEETNNIGRKGAVFPMYPPKN